MRKQVFNSLIIFLFIAVSGMLLGSCKGASDADIQKSVNEKIASNADMAGVTATVSGGVVTLNGQCNDDNCRNTCAQTVKGIKGVKDVVNNITVAAPVVITPDDPLKQGVDAALSSYNGVTADVNDGVITLRGDIKRADLQKLMVSLNALRPKKIDNQLSVK